MIRECRAIRTAPEMQHVSGRKQRASLVADKDRDIVARQIRVEMAKRGLTQAKLGEISAYDERTIRNILKGLPVKDSTLYEICASLKIDLSKLLQGFQRETPNRETGRKAERASIAVLPFSNMSGNAGQDYLVDGIVEDIITELSRFSELFVIARNSTFQLKGRAIDVRQAGKELGAHYVVEGSVRCSKNRIRVTAQLINADSGTHIWAERYDHALKDVFLVQDDIAQTIASVLVAHVKKAEPARVLNKPPESWEAYDCYLRAADLFSSFPNFTDVEKIYQARRLLERALSLDPNYARAHALLAATHMTTWVHPLDSDLLNPDALERAHVAAQTAVRLEPNLPQGHGELGHVLVHKRQHDAAIAEFERACMLNPNYIHWRHGATLTFSGDPVRAIDTLKTQMRRDPFYPVHALSFLGHAYIVAKRYAEAVPPLLEAINRAPNFRPGHLFLANAYARLGRAEGAHTEAEQVLRLDPKFSISRTPRLLAPFKRDDDFEHFVEGFRAAGLPD